MPDTLTDTEVKELKEILSDAESCARLSQWEDEFLSDIRDRFLIYADKLKISDRQWQIIRRIQEKVYA